MNMNGKFDIREKFVKTGIDGFYQFNYLTLFYYPVKIHNNYEECTEIYPGIMGYGKFNFSSLDRYPN